MTNSREQVSKTESCCLSKEEAEKVKANEEAVFQILHKSLQLYKPDEIFLAFNGGKDCTLLLELLSRYFSNGALKHIRLPVLYIQENDSFDEVEQFVNECASRYNIDLVRMQGPLKQAFTQFTVDRPSIKAVFMGSRRSDPYCDQLKIMQPCDPGWPAVMRINPIIDWTVRDVWNYLRSNGVPYCSLYEKGYTSLGGKKNTVPNPHLLIRESCPLDPKYRPAYDLIYDDSLERAGRTDTTPSLNCTQPQFRTINFRD